MSLLRLPRCGNAYPLWPIYGAVSVYCTSWTFSVRWALLRAAGSNSPRIYIGPPIVFTGWWVFLRKLVTAGRGTQHHLDRRSDLGPVRQEPGTRRRGHPGGPGRDHALHRAAELQALAASLQVITFTFPAGAVTATNIDLVPDYWSGTRVALGLSVFSIMFNVHNIDVNERHHG